MKLVFLEKYYQSRLQSVESSLAQLVGDLANKDFNKQVLAGYLKNIFSTQPCIDDKCLSDVCTSRNNQTMYI